MRTTSWAALLLGTLPAMVARGGEAKPAVAPAAPIHIGARLEPLVDEFLIDKTDGVALTLHKPQPREVAIVHDKPWEGNVCCYHTVLTDGEKFRMYYRGAHYDEATKKSTHPELVCYAESTDGIVWTKPELGLVEFDGSKQNNIIWDGIGTHNFAPFKDPNPDCKPDAKFKALGSGKGGLYPFKSPDGVHWTMMSDKPVITDGAFDSQNLAFFDVIRGRYVDFHRDFQKGVRDIKTSTSSDFLNWSETAWLDYLGAPPEHLYTNQVTPYSRAPHIFMGFPKRFRPGRRPVANRNPGVSDGVFMTSRDGVRFKRWGEALIRPGLQPERWVNRNNMTAWGILETKSALPGTPNELSIYSTEGYYRGESCQLRRFTVRLDGFVSVQAPYRGGAFVTKPIIFDPPAPRTDESTARVAEPLVGVDSDRPLIGKRSLVFKEPVYLVLPGTQNLGPKATLAVHVRGVPAGHRRLFSTYDGRSTKPKELYFDINADGDKGVGGQAIRFGYDGWSVDAASGKVGNWSVQADPDTTHHLAATWDDGVVTIYFDGKQVARGGETGGGDLEFRLGDVRFGEDYPPTSLVNEPFVGSADDILVLRRVLTADEIQRVAKQGAAAVLDPKQEAGVLYTAEGKDRRTLNDALTGDGARDTILPAPPGPAESELLVNFSTSAAGSFRCEILDEKGSPLPGYSLAESDEMFGDAIERAVSWRRGHTEVKPLAGRPVRLRFVMKDADLYALRFGTPGR